MANKLSYSLSTPERELAQGTADKIDIPGSAGWFCAMPGHTPVVSTLFPGVVHIWNSETRQSIYIGGGFADVTPQEVTILAEKAIPMEELNPPLLEQDIMNLQESLVGANINETRRLIEIALDELKRIQSAIQ